MEKVVEDKNIVLVKLGGSIITDKDKPRVANMPRIEQLADEIHRSRRDHGRLMIIGHGAGSFGHPPASRYGTIEGLVHSESRRGAIEVRSGLREINNLLTDQLASTGEYPISLPAAAFLTSRNGQLDRLFIQPVVNLLDFGLLPVTPGDVVTDSKIGFTIFSGEKVLNFLAVALLKTHYKPRLIIEVSDSRGIEARARGGETIPIIDQSNIRSVEENLFPSSTIDVTGGMTHKINEAFTLAKSGIPTFIISPRIDNLYRAIQGSEDVEGTLIRFTN